MGYDNHENKKPHVHRHGKEYPYNFRDIETALDDFYEEVKELIRSDSNGENKN